MSADEVHSHQLRLDRALQHLQNLESEAQRWLGTNPYSVTDKFDAQRGENIIRIEVLRQPPPTFAVIIGDYLHNLRSGLDNLAYGLAEVYIGTPLPPKMAERSEFPTFGHRAMRADERSRKIGGIHPDAQAIIEQLQPYNRGQNFASDPLWLLHELSRIDKHRLPHLTLFAHVSTGFGADNAFVESMAITGGGAIEHSAELAQYRARPINPSKKMDMDFSFEFNIAFAQGPPAYGEAAIPLLTSLRNYIIDEVLSPLVCYFN